MNPEIVNPYTDCGLVRIFGGVGQFSNSFQLSKTFYTTFTAPSHFKFEISFEIYFFDVDSTVSIVIDPLQPQPESDGLEVFINGVSKKKVKLTDLTNRGNLCGDSKPEFSDTIIVKHLTEGSSAALEFSSEFTLGDATKKGWGMRNLNFYQYFCASSCFTCFGDSDSNCKTCNPDSFLEVISEQEKVCKCPSFTHLTPIYGPTKTDLCNSIPCSKCVECHPTCKTCSQGGMENKCKSCEEPRYLKDSICVLDKSILYKMIGGQGEG
jgi:hypothetical protein